MRGKYGRTAVALHEAARFEAIELVLYGETMEWAAEVLRPVLPAGGGVVDVCPALGGLTLALAAHAGPAAPLLALEPRAPLRAALNASLAHLAAATAGGRRRGALPGAWALAAEWEEEAAARAVEGAALLRVSRGEGCPAPEALLRAAGGALARAVRRAQPVLYLEAARGPPARALQAAVRAAGGQGYRCFWSAGRLFRAGNARGQRANVFGPALSRFNLLCAPPRIALHGLRPVDDDVPAPAPAPSAPPRAPRS